MKKFIPIVAVLAVLLLAASVRAQQYEATTIVNLQGTNNPGVATNVAAVVGLTRYSSFSLEVFWGATNASAGTLDLQWATSGNGTDYTTAPVAAGSSGWFSVPLTNGGAAGCWTTNITLTDVGYWRINWLTNASGQHTTNYIINAYKKPRKSG